MAAVQQMDLEKKMDAMTLEGKHFTTDISNILTTLQTYHNKAHYGIIEDQLWTPIEKPTVQGEQRLNKARKKAIQNVKTRLTYIAADLQNLAREMNVSQKATYRHACVKRRRKEFGASEKTRLENKKKRRQETIKDREALASSGTPSIADLLDVSDDDIDDPFQVFIEIHLLNISHSEVSKLGHVERSKRDE